MNWLDLPLLLMIPYPIIIGISKGNINITFFNDITVFSFFLLKILIIRTLILRFIEKTDFDTIFRRYARKIIKQSIIAAILMLMIAYIALAVGLRFYYQAPAELTFAAALAIAQGYAPTYLLILTIAAIGGKRGILIGILIIGILGSLTRRNFTKVIVTAVVLTTLAIAAFFIAGDSSSLGDAVFMRRLTGTWLNIKSVATEARAWEEFFMFIDPNRFVEYISLKPHLKGWALWFGNGYGFRYDLDFNFLAEFGRIGLEGSVTNAHFTPLAIVAKFGLMGLILWIIQVLGIIFTSRNPKSYFQAASRLGFISMLVQAIFAFSFFISFFSPLFIAGATSRNARYSGTLVNGVGQPHLTKVK
ncbi:hypothetical protein SAMN04488041_11163 [Sulfitobacter pontiacus]|uniref:Uncharacterized protein n=1 Tax=Sulfitobacter pontiacus TaxID=60137 RepID=A0A1H3DMX6_9RHOB|nr:hypothetical protein [Sulfitobacter pontiacus]SDX67863.1 hypothetical protein SAMN04488041_11163 [Sulfitobacter pontiacus]